jgi:hypothetical protein
LRREEERYTAGKEVLTYLSSRGDSLSGSRGGLGSGSGSLREREGRAGRQEKKGP